MNNQKYQKYKFWALVTDDKHCKVKDVPCEILVPINNTDKIKVTLYPTSNEQYKKLTGFSKCRISGFMQHSDGVIQNEILITDSYITGSNRIGWGAYPDEYIINIHPFNLEIITPINNNEDRKNILGSFWISPNSYLKPFKSRTLSYTGKISMKMGRQIKQKAPNHTLFTFDSNYKYYDYKNKQISFSESVARFEVTNGYIKIKEHLRCIDDLLLFTSFAERKRVSCIGWDILSSESQTNYYRRNISMKDFKTDKDTYNDNMVIDIIHFEKYLNHSIEKFENINFKKLLKQAIQVISHKNTNIIEENFISTFTAIETLILFASLENKFSNKILPKDMWNSLKTEIKSTINESSTFKGLEKPKLIQRSMCNKLEELNRLSFSGSINYFYKKYNVQVDDLWPLLGGKYISLKNIRDQLVHGKKVDDEQYSALWCAENHLRWIAERMVLAILDWDLEKTKISYKGMEHIYPYRDLEIHQKNINGWKNS